VSVRHIQFGGNGDLRQSVAPALVTLTGARGAAGTPSSGTARALIIGSFFQFHQLREVECVDPYGGQAWRGFGPYKFVT
jgi:hypothetical protein